MTESFNPWAVKLDPQFVQYNDEDLLAEYHRRLEALDDANAEINERFKAFFIKAAGSELRHIDGVDSASTWSYLTGGYEIIWCFYCGERPGWQREHKFPRFRGGTDDKANIVRACRTCNLRKGKMTLEEYRKKLEEKSYAPIVFAGERVNSSRTAKSA